MQIPSVPSTIFLRPRAVTPRLLATLLFAVMAATLLSACGGEDAPPATAAPEPPATQAPEPAATPIPTPAPSPKEVEPESPDEPEGLTAEDLTSADLGFPRFAHNATYLQDGRILVSSGYTGTANNDVIVPFEIGVLQLYNPAAGNWMALEPVEGPGVLFSAVALDDGRVLFVGLGGPQSSELSMASIFDPATDTWSSVAAPSDARGRPDLVLLSDGRVMVAGGVDFLSGDFYDWPTVQSVEVFDPATENWGPLGGMQQGTEVQWLFPVSGGRVFAITNIDGGFLDEKAHAEIYDPTADAWSAVSSLEPYYEPVGAVQLADGRLLVHGALSTNGGLTTPDGSRLLIVLPDDREIRGDLIEQQLAEARVYDPLADDWSPTGRMTSIRENATFTLLPDGRVLVVGGEDPDTSGYVYYTTTEIYDPSTNTWQDGPDLLEPRANHTATLMPDGSVLLAGGITVNPENGERYPTGTTEIVSP